ncbi:TIGR02996 domain-containing protein [Pyxidicoccus trucidator]|uniref:TIGR02996 domain-containing protein n=1 Tax=Pyxidicoccus trucidator TaxID=2709662 RepID=UPI0013DB4C0C|nr:TIGR02996 domain-containing protein [Pyxidicoccus trucidator]
MSETLNDLLRRACEAFERHAEEEALVRLLEAWREARTEELATLVERLSKRLTQGLSPLECEPGSLTMRECRPLDLPRLLVSVREGAERGYAGSVRRSLLGLQQWPVDPRFTPVLLDIARMPISGDVGVPEVLFALLEQVGDPRALEPLRELRRELASGVARAARLDAILQRIPHPGPPLEASASSRCTELDEALTEREATEARNAPLRDALLARVYADPDDDAARMVLADHLLEQGDPLGEFITLQCLPRPEVARIEQLLEAHRARWEAPLGPYVVQGITRFERGFPAVVQLDRWWRELLPEPGPCWSTVREIDWAAAMFPDVPAWLSHPHLRHVTVLQRLDAELARGLGARGLGLRRLGLLGSVSRKCPDLFSRLAGLTHLKHVRVEDADAKDVALCATSPLASRLERFDAGNEGGWALTVRPERPMPVQATLEHEDSATALAEALHGALRFGARAGLHLRVEHDTEVSRRVLEAAAKGYERVEWS